MRAAELAAAAANAAADAAEEAAAKKTTALTPEGDRENYLSDTIVFQFDFFAQRVDLTSSPNTTNPSCVRALSELKGIGLIGVGQKLEPFPAFKVMSVPSSKDSNKKYRCTEDNVARQDDIVVIPKNILLGTPPSRIGLTYGTLLVPYKYQLNGSKSFTGSATVGGYIGYRSDNSLLGVELQYVFFLGASPVSVSSTGADGQTTTQNMFGASYGIGLLGKIKGNFNMGAVYGADKVNDSANYENNGKPWIAIELGYSFSN